MDNVSSNTIAKIDDNLILNEFKKLEIKYAEAKTQRKKQEEVQDLEGLQTMRTLGRNMAFFLKCKEAGLKNGVKMPEREAGVFTNFIR